MNWGILLNVQCAFFIFNSHYSVELGFLEFLAVQNPFILLERGLSFCLGILLICFWFTSFGSLLCFPSPSRGGAWPLSVTASCLRAHPELIPGFLLKYLKEDFAFSYWLDCERMWNGVLSPGRSWKWTVNRV